MESALRIDRFSGQYAFLSNFYLCHLHTLDGTYATVEHAYQASKTLDPNQRAFVRRAKTAGEAKRRGRRVTLKPDWEETKLDVMLNLLRQKFSAGHPELVRALIATAPAELVEGNTWGDRYWGAVDGEGENHLGHLLMQVRAELMT
jgi:ribA/ribD-fused uncharacterized protein